jgi:hypothetical protein
LFALKFGFTPEQVDKMDFTRVEAFKELLARYMEITKGETIQNLFGG